MRSRLNRILCILICIPVCIGYNAVGVDAKVRVKENRRALSVYSKLLKKTQYTYDSVYQESDFGLVDIDKNGVKELIFRTNGIAVANNFDEIWTYRNGNLLRVQSYSSYPEISIYKDGLIGYVGGRMGHKSNTYEKIVKGKAKRVCGYEACDDDSYNALRQEYRYKYRVRVVDKFWEGVSEKTIFHCTPPKVNGKTVSYKKFKTWERNHEKKVKKVKIKYYKNTASNRERYLK